ncbi:MAG: hypothetical protein HC908_16095 [Calothrix sp. SM1_7_51]|nr:hypothetical protein [Calothrix sp. SM1_7_51]
MLAKYMGEGGWHIQIDVDEYFINFSDFVKFLSHQSKYLQDPEKKPIIFIANLIVLYKKTINGFLYVKNSYDTLSIATNYPQYKSARNNNHSCVHHPIFFSFIKLGQEMTKKFCLKLRIGVTLKILRLIATLNFGKQ